MKTAIFPGSFDPITLGHQDIIEKSLNLFDVVIIGIGQNSEKKYMFSAKKRKQFVEQTFNSIDNIEVKIYEGLTIDFCRKNNADYIIRGLRNVSDFEFEKNIALTNRKLSGIETVFFFMSLTIDKKQDFFKKLIFDNETVPIYSNLFFNEIININLFFELVRNFICSSRVFGYMP